MDKLRDVTARFADVPWMDAGRAEVVRRIVEHYDVGDILEIGFLHGKSSACFGAIQEDRGKGHTVTVDRETARAARPGIGEILAASGLDHRVTPVFAKRSFTWELARMIAARPRPQFDLCYLDAGKTWDAEGFAFFLIDVLLKPGGLILFDDLNWTMADSAQYRRNPDRYARYDADELHAQPIRMIWDELVPHLGYAHIEVFERYQWGLAQKPLAGGGPAPAPLPADGTARRLFWRAGWAARRRLGRLR